MSLGLYRWYGSTVLNFHIQTEMEREEDRLKLGTDGDKRWRHEGDMGG